MAIIESKYSEELVSEEFVENIAPEEKIIKVFG